MSIMNPDNTPDNTNEQNQVEMMEDNNSNEQNQEVEMEASNVAEQPSTSSSAPAPGGSNADEILPDYNDNENEEPSGIQQFRNHFFKEWSGAEHLFKIVLQTEQADTDSGWSSPSTSPPPPLAFSINIDFNADDILKEDNMRHLINAIDTIMPHSNVGREIRSDVLKYLDLDFYTYKAAISKTQEWMWEAEKTLETDSQSASESDST